jgi:hypothetical protein
MPTAASVQLKSQTQIDILIPAIEKDLGTLPYVIDAARKQVKHPIGDIMIVAPRKRRIIELCHRKGCKFIDENTVLPITKQHINYRSKKWERSGWLFQQLLKLSGDKICKSDFYLTIDADTVLIRPHIFRKGHKTVFFCRNWSQDEYYKTYFKLLKRKPASRLSFVTHYMLFEKSKVKQLKHTIEANHQMTWYSAILKKINRTKQFAFSEFETYGNFLYARFPHGWIQKQALNKSLSINPKRLTQTKLNRLSQKYRSLSFHKRKGYLRNSQEKL